MSRRAGHGAAGHVAVPGWLAATRGWVVALRIARREARRAKGRTALVVLMIALPVAALSFFAATYDMYRLSPAERVTRQMGAADALVQWSGDEPITLAPDGSVSVAGGPARTAAATAPPVGPHTQAAMLAHAPAGASATPFVQGTAVVHTSSGIGGLAAYGIDLSSPITAGLVHLDSGRMPRTDTEALASPAALDRLGLAVGGTITPAAADGLLSGKAYTVVGVAEVGGSLDQYLVFRPGAIATPIASWLVASPQPFTIDRVNALGAIGAQVTSRYLALHPPPGFSGRDYTPNLAGFSIFGIGTVIAGLGLFEVVLLAGPAFAVGARRRERGLALVAAAGGTSATLRRIVLSDGIVGGVAAAIVGLVVGLAAAMGGRSIMEQYLAHARFGAYRVYPAAIGAVVVLALVTGLLGALVPAVTASRQDVVASLSGRRGAVRSRRRWIGLGAAAVACGAAATYVGAHRHDSTIVLVGLTVGQFGVVLWTPALIGAVGRLGRFLPVATRITLRDASRRRAAAAPAISAVMAAVAGSVALTVYLGASADQPTGYRSVLPAGSFAVTVDGSADTATLARIVDAINTTAPGSAPVVVTTNGSAATVLPVLPSAQRCPYIDADGSISRELSSADQRRALADPRCANTLSGLGWLGTIVTADPAVLTATLGLQGAQLDAAVRALAAGEAVVNDPRYVSAGSIQLAVEQVAADGSAAGDATVGLAAYAFASDHTTEIAISPATAARLNIATKTADVVGTPPASLTQPQQDALQAALAAMTTQGTQPSLDLEPGPTRPHRLIGVALAAAAGVIALGAAAIATGLGAVDGRRDLRTLGAIGATPSVRKRLALAQAGVIAGLGSLLGALVGEGAGAAVLFGLNQVWAGRWPVVQPAYPIEIPWRNLAISVILVPLVAMLGAAILTRSRLPIERRPG